jgi:hypothetical protein
MFEKMLDMVKNEVTNVVGGLGGIPKSSQGMVVDTAANSLMSNLKQYANPSTLGSLLGIGGAKGGASLTSGLSAGLVGDLTSKAGLAPGVAQGVAGKIIPAVMSLFKKQVNDPAQPGFNLQSMIGAIAGGGAIGGMGGRSSGTPAGSAGSGGGIFGSGGGLGGGLGGILGGLGNLFGKKV